MLLRGLCARGALFALFVLTLLAFGVGKVNAASDPNITGLTVTAPAGGVEGASTPTYSVASFTVDGVNDKVGDSYTVTVNWGDGSTADVFTGVAPTAHLSFVVDAGVVSDTHTYFDEGGPFTVSVSVTDNTNVATM